MWWMCISYVCAFTNTRVVHRVPKALTGTGSHHTPSSSHWKAIRWSDGAEFGRCSASTLLVLEHVASIIWAFCFWIKKLLGSWLVGPFQEFKEVHARGRRKETETELGFEEERTGQKWMFKRRDQDKSFTCNREHKSQTTVSLERTLERWLPESCMASILHQRDVCGIPKTQRKLLNLLCASACWTNCLGLNFTPSNFSRASKKKGLHCIYWTNDWARSKPNLLMILVWKLVFKLQPRRWMRFEVLFAFWPRRFILFATGMLVHAQMRRTFDEDQVGIEVPILSFPFGQLLCIFPPGGGVPVPPLPIHWYYIMAAGGALLLLAAAILVRALCCCRQHLATKKSQLSVAYHSSSQCFQYSNWSTSMATPGVEPVLTVRLDSRDRHRTLC